MMLVNSGNNHGSAATAAIIQSQPGLPQETDLIMNTTAASAAAGAHDSGPQEHFIGSPSKRLRKPVSPNVARRGMRRAAAPSAQWDDPNLQDAEDVARALDRAALAQAEAKADALEQQLTKHRRCAEEELTACKKLIESLQIDERLELGDGLRKAPRTRGATATPSRVP